jgi:microcystin-dependent protein
MTAALPMGGQKITGMADPTISTDAATKNYVDNSASFSTGDFKLTIKIVADTGWVLCNDGTIGSATSGASYQNSNAQALFTLIFNNIIDGYSPIFTSGGGATTRAAQVSASAAWAANCRISLTTMLGRALGFASGGAGLTVRGLGQFMGEENHALIAAENGPHNHSGLTGNENANHTHGGLFAALVSITQGAASTFINIWQGIGSNTNAESINHQHVIPSDGSGTPHNTMQPTVFVNVMIKL